MKQGFLATLALGALLTTPAQAETSFLHARPVPALAGIDLNSVPAACKPSAAALKDPPKHYPYDFELNHHIAWVNNGAFFHLEVVIEARAAGDKSSQSIDPLEIDAIREIVSRHEVGPYANNTRSEQGLDAHDAELVCAISLDVLGQNIVSWP